MKSLFWRNDSKLISESSLPKIQTGLTFTYLNDLKIFVLIGGLKAETEKKEAPPPAKKNPFASKSASTIQQKIHQIEDVWIYQPEQKTWKIQICTGKFPPQRIHHYVNYSAPYLTVYGGIDKKLYSDIYLLNCQTWIWKKLVVLDSHIPRLYGSMIPYISNKINKRFFIGGASSLQNIDILGDAWVLSLEGVIDSNNNELPGAFWSKIQLNNQFVPVKNFSANLIAEDKAFIFGGSISNTTNTNNAYVLEMAHNRIKLIPTKGVKPSSRSNHQSCLIKQNLLVFIGGQLEPGSKQIDEDIFVYHINIETWEKVVPGGNCPFNSTPFCIASKGEESKGELIFLNQSNTGSTSQCILQEMVQNQQFKVIENESIVEYDKDNLSVSEELKQGYELNEEQKRKIEELEQKLEATKERNRLMKYKIEKVRVEPLPLSQRFTSNRTELSSKLLQLLLLEHKKRKFLELKSLMLQNTIKDTSKLVVMLNNFSDPDAKNNHIKVMKDYRIDMQEIENKQKLLRKQITSKNNIMGLDLKKLFVDSLSVEENGLLSLLL